MARSRGSFGLSFVVTRRHYRSAVPVGHSLQIGVRAGGLPGQSKIASDFCQMCVVWQCGHRTVLPVSTDRWKDSGSIVMPVLTGLPVVGHVIEIAATGPSLPDWLTFAVPSTRSNLPAELSADRRLGPGGG